MPMPQPAQPRDPALRQDVVLILADVQAEVPGYWNLALDVHERPTRRFRDGRVWQRTPLEVGALRAFEERRDILADGNYRISLSGDPATIDFLEVMRAKLIVSEGQEPIEIVIVEEEEVIEREPEPGEAPTVLERRLRYRRLGHADAPLPDDMIVFDLSSDGGSDAEGRQIPVDIPGARVIGWRGLRNRNRMVHEAYAEAAARSLIARAEHLGAQRPEDWGIYVGRRAQRAVAVLRASRGFYAGRMIPILVQQQWRRDVPGEPLAWRPLGLKLLESTRVA
jgi:hypothetical protein